MAENAGGGGAKAAGPAAAQQQAKKRVALGNLTNVAAPGGRSGCGKIAVVAAGNAVRIRTRGNARLGAFRCQIVIGALSYGGPRVIQDL
jgi:hypothetical protein